MAGTAGRGQVTTSIVHPTPFSCEPRSQNNLMGCPDGDKVACSCHDAGRKISYPSPRTLRIGSSAIANVATKYKTAAMNTLIENTRLLSGEYGHTTHSMLNRSSGKHGKICGVLPKGNSGQGAGILRGRRPSSLFRNRSASLIQ